MPTDRVDLIPSRQDEISNNAPADFGGTTDPREFRALRLGDRWSPEADVTLGATTIQANLLYRLTANPGKLAGAAVEADLMDWENLQDYVALINKPDFYSWIINGQTHEISPSAVGAVHTGKINLSKDVAGHDLLDRTHQQIAAQNFTFALIFGRAF